MLHLEGSRARDSLVAVAGPLMVVAVSYSLWFVSDRLLYIGPFDRATFGWAVVMPMWFISPAVAALLWQRLSDTRARTAALIAAVIITAAAAWLLWIAFDPQACETGLRTSAAGLTLPSIFLGAVIGIGWAVCGLIGRAVARSGRPWQGALTSVALAVGHLVLVLGAFTFIVIGYGGCNRPGAP